MKGLWNILQSIRNEVEKVLHKMTAPFSQMEYCDDASYGVSIRCSTNHRLAYAMKKSVMGNTTRAVLIL